MTTTLGTLILAEPALDRIGNMPMVQKDRYHVKRLIASVRAETKHYKEERERLITELGKEVNGMPSLAGDSPNMPTFVKEMKALEKVEVTIDKWLLTHAMMDPLTISANDELLLEDAGLVEKEK